MGVAGEIRRLDRPKMAKLLACTLLACAKGLTPQRMPAAPKTAQKVATVESLGEAVAVAAPDAFDWFDHWYPVNVVDSMDPSRPHKVQLLGLNLVLWNDGATVRGEKAAGSWRAFEDSCPHRRGPLSEGRVEDDGTLLCSYHGWRYDGSGACSDLPYSPESKRERPSGNFGEGTQSAKDFDVEQMVSNFENGTELLRLRAELEASKKSMSDSKQALKMAANDYFKGGAH